MAVVESQEECKIGKSQFLSYNLSLLLTTCFSLKRSDEGDFTLFNTLDPQVCFYIFNVLNN